MNFYKTFLTSVFVLGLLVDFVLLVILVNASRQIQIVLLWSSFQKNKIFISNTEVTCDPKYVINCTLTRNLDKKTNEYSLSGTAMYAVPLNSFYVSWHLQVVHFNTLLTNYSLVYWMKWPWWVRAKRWLFLIELLTFVATWSRRRELILCWKSFMISWANMESLRKSVLLSQMSNIILKILY